MDNVSEPTLSAKNFSWQSLKHSIFSKLSNISPFFRINLLAVIVGVIGGLGAWIFRLGIELFYMLLFVIPQKMLTDFGFKSHSWLPFLVSPIIGGLIVGLLTSRVSQEVKGHGVPEVLETVALHHGKMGFRVPFVKILASAATLGSGGSAGREGPIAQIGAGFASLLGQKLGLTPEEKKVLVISGVAAGIAATFNAPIGGSLFAIEILTRGTQKLLFLPIVLAAVVGTITGQFFLGSNPAFVGFPQLRYHDPFLIPFFLAIGLFCGLLSAYWIKFFYFFEDVFEKFCYNSNIPEFLRATIGGFGVGLILLLTYLIVGEEWELYTTMGRVYTPMNAVFTEKLLLESVEVILLTLLLLFLLKLLATVFTIGSGGSGGVFAPSLFLGVMLGAFIGAVFKHVLVFENTDIVLFAVLGMAAFFAGTGRAPLTAVIMTAEMTEDFFLTIPLMLVVSVSYLVSSRIEPNDIYVMKLLRRGVTLEAISKDILDQIRVSQAMTPREKLVTVDVKARLETVLELVRKTRHEGFPVFDGDKFVGIITLSDVQEALQEHPRDWIVKHIIEMKSSSRPVVGISKDASLTDAVTLMEKKDVSRLPVLEKKNGKIELIGWLTNHDITRCFVAEKAETLIEEESEKYLMSTS